MTSKKTAGLLTLIAVLGLGSYVVVATAEQEPRADAATDQFSDQPPDGVLERTGGPFVSELVARAKALDIARTQMVDRVTPVLREVIFSDYATAQARVGGGVNMAIAPDRELYVVELTGRFQSKRMLGPGKFTTLFVFVDATTGGTLETHRLGRIPE